MGGTARKAGGALAGGALGTVAMPGAGTAIGAGLGGSLGGKGGGKNGGPTPPDFLEAARETSRTSRNDINGTFGGATWEQTPDGRWSLNTSMAPELQAQAGRLMGSLGNMPDPSQARDQALDAAYRMQTSRLDPRLGQQQSSLETQLANEGFSRGDAGWNQAMDSFGRERNDAYQQALLGAQSGAGNTAYAQTLAAAMQPYQQLGALQNLGEGAGRQVLAQAQPVDALGAAGQQYGGALQQYGIGQQNKNSKNSGMASTLPLLLAA